MAERLSTKSADDVLKTFFRAREKFKIKFKRPRKGSYTIFANKNGVNFNVIRQKKIIVCVSCGRPANQ